MPQLEVSSLTILLAQIAAILVVSRALGVITRGLGQPLVIAEVMAGILLGPSLLGWLWPEAMAALFPKESLSVLQRLSELGLVLFMFLVGLELDPKLLKGRTQASVAISHASIVLPFSLGAAAAWFLYDDYASGNTSFLSFMLFLGAAMSVTAFPVLARILSERHLMTSRVGAITIACAAVDDVTAWCILAFVVAVARTQGVVPALWTTSLALLYIAAMWFVIKPFLQRVGARVASREGLTPTVVAMILLLLLGSSALTEMIGIHALFGAFLFGAILPKEGKLAETLADKLETVAVILLLPLFFAYSGLRTQLGLVSEPGDWLVLGALIAIATLGKFGGSAVAARLTGMRWREASAIGILMNTRGLMELIVLNLGMDLGVISPTIFTMLVIMALVTTFATTPVLRWVYPDQELARDRSSETLDSMITSPPPFTVMMCVSDRTSGPGLVTMAAALQGTHADAARLFALHLRPASDRPSAELRYENQDDPESSPLAPLLSHGRELGVDVRPLGFVSSEPAEDIRRTAEAKHASLVLLGTHKPLLLGGRLSGTVREVIESAKVPVGVLVDRGLQKVEHALVAYVGSAEDLVALQFARRMALASRTQLTLLRLQASRFNEEARAMRTPVEQEIQSLERELRSAPLLARVIAPVSSADAVVAEARRGYDVVILGMSSEWDLDAGALSRRGSVWSDSPVSILALHRGLAAAAELAEPDLDTARLADPVSA